MGTDITVMPRPGLTQERERRLEQVMDELERRFGRRVVYRLRERLTCAERYRSISFGSLGLDRASGVGGAPRGRLTELHGAPGCGKGVVAYHVLANAQKGGGLAALIDAGGSLDWERLRSCRVDLADLLLAMPQTGGEALDIASLLVSCGGLDALVLAPMPWRLLGSSLRRLGACLSGSPTAVLLLTTGIVPAEIRHLATLRMQLSPLYPLVHPSGDIAGLRVHAAVEKNRLAAPGGRVEFDLRLDRGIHHEAELFDLALSHGLLEEHRLGFLWQGDVLGQGRGRAVAALEHRPSVAAALAASLVGRL